MRLTQDDESVSCICVNLSMQMIENGVVDRSDACAAIQRDLNRWEKWEERYSQSWTTRNAEPCNWEGIAPCTPVHAGDWLARKQLRNKGLAGHSEQQVTSEPVIWPCSKGGKQYLNCISKCSSWREAIFNRYSRLVKTSRVFCPSLGSPVQRTWTYWSKPSERPL